MAYTTALEGVAASLAGAAPASLSSLTPTTVALLLQAATGAGGVDGDSSCSSSLLQRAAAAALGGLSPPQLSEYAGRRLLCGKVDQEGAVRHMAFLLLRGDQPGPQACWRLLLGKEQHQEQHGQRFTAALYRLPAHGSGSTAVLALLAHGIATVAAAAHVDGGRLCRRSLQYLHTASIVLGPALWGGASTEGTRALLLLLHESVLTVLAASIGNNNSSAAVGTGEEGDDAASALRLVARVASAALTHAPCIAGEEPLPFVPVASRLLLLLSPCKEAAARNCDAQQHAEVVAAVLALLNQLMALGRLPPDAPRT